ncbi:S-4TM family putative pore-forming effector [Actinomadura bangladeshensis]|uniref:Uncharacterized protein n=1 Tax=Actinomadura bangladeshensis TaxID=453573 RepID=A0A6L9QI13_9ACTN|nr:S-4TM family putative pore-forming effector [Actinomadura bangladeshensis]NEA24728.1 hypothetical protein [Actinomadura bangladeshensis]
MADNRLPVSNRQNYPDMIELRQAAAAVHAKALRVETSRVAISLLLAISGILAAFIRGTAPPIAIAGALWAVALAVGINPWVKGLAKNAAILQEMFDVELFGLPWNKTICGNPLAHYEYVELARKFPVRGQRLERLRDWYVNVNEIPQPYDVLFCQLQNLVWDARLRRRWARIVLTSILSWIVLGILVGYIADLSVKETLIGWYLPAMGAFLLGLDNYRGQLEISSERERVAQLVHSELDRAKRPPLSKAELRELRKSAREIQDVILVTRKHTARVPDWFYRRYRPGDESDFQASAETLKRKLNSA